MRNRIVCQTLDRVVVRVLEDALQLGRPDDDALVGAAGRKSLAVPGVRDAVDVVLVAWPEHKRMLKRSIGSSIGEVIAIRRRVLQSLCEICNT
jgi:hypothetical protein